MSVSQGIVPILVDCSQRSANTELKQRYGIRGFPTVLFVSPSGAVVDRMRSRSAADIRGQILNLAGRYKSQAASAGPQEIEPLSASDKRPAIHPMVLVIFLAGILFAGAIYFYVNGE